MHINELQVVQNTALRLILNVPRYVSRRHLHADLDVSPIHTRIKKLEPRLSSRTSQTTATTSSPKLQTSPLAYIDTQPPQRTSKISFSLHIITTNLEIFHPPFFALF
ncbi:hypothetical protein TNIN_359611 [Trichonephila inaurata madagascariensis]|uniref:Uncharacterized protein n=1 Tax=Trichonephila inaurata madagascariensis TaxID=2747483 RepID=A0A8X6YRM6_9ARAC|nr:hypothetical protein TNIN_359611 [Trichonephila inaurata madagascariensis]